MVMVDESGVILMVNTQTERLFGYSREELIGRPIETLIPERFRPQHPSHRKRFFAAPSVRGLGAGRDLFGRRKDGTEVAVEIGLTPIETVQGPRVLASVVDITERKQLEEQLRHAQKMEAVGQLAGGIAHDFNNLLTALLGSCGFLRGGLPPGDPLIEEVDEIQKAGTRAATLTRHLLAFSRKQILQPQVLDLNDVVAGMEGSLRRLIGENIALVTTVGPSLWRVKIDPSQIEQAVLNLVLNACDAMPQGGRIAITTTNLAVTEATDIGKSLLPPGSYATLTVSDSGGGMDAKTLAHLFEPFFTTKEVGKGTGLGLAMVHGIITQSGGHVGVANEAGRRAAFTLYLPRVEEPLESPQPDVARAEPLQGAGTIVVVEDEEMIRTVACRVLERSGYRVLSAAYSDEALLLAGRYEGGIALLITDVVLPGMNGRELAERLRSVHPAMKVLYMSGYTDDVAVQHGVLSARLPFLQKPFTPDDLTRKVREVLGAGEAG
jgi:PAS domain S-box-containing protein